MATGHLILCKVEIKLVEILQNWWNHSVPTSFLQTEEAWMSSQSLVAMTNMDNRTWMRRSKVSFSEASPNFHTQQQRQTAFIKTAGWNPARESNHQLLLLIYVFLLCIQCCRCTPCSFPLERSPCSFVLRNIYH